MSQLPYRANLNSSHFPFLKAYHNQTVILPGKDQAFQSQIVIGQDSEDKDKGFPQLYYCHNVIPTNRGFQSVGFIERFAGISGSILFDDLYTLRDINENKYLFSPANGGNYVYNSTTGWTTAGAMTVSSDLAVSVAYINGHTYIFYPNDNVYEFNVATGVFDIVVLTGVTVANLLGICASNGFMMAWDGFTVYRSKATDPLDFTPDFSLGSGASIPEDEEGRIVTLLKINNGFIIYTTKNAVSGTYSQNIRYPFNYVEIQNSAGILSPRHVAWQNNTGVHYAWTQAGLQKVDKIKAASVFPEVTDFLTAGKIEYYDTATNTFIEEEIAGSLYIKIAVSGKRYICISYGVSGGLYSQAILYDLLYKRWGKIKIDHAAIFELSIPSEPGILTWNQLNPLSWDNLGDTSWDGLGSIINTYEEPKSNIAILKIDGTILTINFDDIHTGDSGVAIVGKYQYIRERTVEIEEIELENIRPTDNFTLTQLISNDGSNISYVATPYQDISSGNYRHWFGAHQEAKNHSLVFSGTFNLSDLGLKFKVGGHR